MTRNTVRGLLYSALIGGAMAAGVLMAPHAKATPAQDAAFYAILQDAGLEIVDYQAAKRTGFLVCGELYTGVPWRTVMAHILSASDLDVDVAAAILAAAIVVYCPDMEPAEFQQNGGWA